jgi:hypothetical protein
MGLTGYTMQTVKSPVNLRLGSGEIRPVSRSENGHRSAARGKEKRPFVGPFSGQRAGIQRDDHAIESLINRVSLCIREFYERPYRAAITGISGARHRKHLNDATR